MRLALQTETYGNQDHSWLGSARGITSARTVTLKVSAFTEGTHFPDGFFPDGLPLALPTSGSNAGFAVPLVASVTERQTVTITGTPTGGTFTLTFDGEATAGIAYNANAAAVQSALEALSNVNSGDVTVGGGPGPGTAYTVDFAGQYLGDNVPVMTASGASLTGGTSPAVAVTTTTGGGSGVTDGSDVLAGFLLYPEAVTADDVKVSGAMIDTGRVIVANLPVALSAAQKATNDHFVWM